MSELSVAYDREVFLLQKIGGVSKCFTKLFLKFTTNETHEICPTFTFERSDNLHLAELIEDLKPQRLFLQARGGWSTLFTLGPIREISSGWAGGAKPKVKTDIFHATYYRPTKSERSMGAKQVVTVHDFIPEKLGWKGLRNPHIGKEQLCRNSDLVICVSKATAEELYERYNINEDRVVVIHHGVDLQPVLTVKKVNSRPSILYVGHRSGYKNFKVLTEALKLARISGFEIDLISAGPALTKSELIENQQLLSSGSWRHVLNPDDLELRNLYSEATLHCVTSKMEGFGMTVLEAMANGTPVILSDISIFREVAGSSGCYFDPASSEDLLQKICWILDSDRYAALRVSSLNLAKSKSWDVVAGQYASAYNRIS
jgi:glycosyltransferase involved in cell wall biosynthesis